jgi:hypothetical protein
LREINTFLLHPICKAKRVLLSALHGQRATFKKSIFYFPNKISSLGPNDSYFRALHLPPRAYTLKKTNKERGYLAFAIALIVEL